MIKLIILDQNKPKTKNKKFKNTFISHKTGNKRSIHAILKSNSTTFMFNNIFCEMDIKKVIYWGLLEWGIGGTVLISSW